MKKNLITILLFLIITPFFLEAQTPTTVKLTRPNGGEKFRAGTSEDLTWDTVGTYRAKWTFQFATSPTGPWTNLGGATNILDSATRRGKFAGGFRVPAVKTTTGYVRIILVNPDGTLNESVSDINDAPFEIEQPEATRSDSVLKDAINTRVKLTSKKIYSLDGYVYVDDGGILEIEAGTIIIGDTVGQNSGICVNRGGKILAQGTAKNPIVMTSSAPPGQRRGGDWGGLLICGKAATNHPGGEAALEGGIADGSTVRVRGWFGGKNAPDDNDNSGIIEYVRIEFAGIAATPNSELNSLTMGAVGRGTKINHVCVSYANDDAYEWFGGTVDAKYLVSVGTLDDDWDCDNGFSGRIQFAVAQRYKERADVSTSQAFEIDNDASGSYNKPYTTVLFSNITAIGPLADTSWTATATGSGEKNYSRNFGAGAQLRRNSRASIVNSLFLGWPRGIELLSTGTQAAANNDSIFIRNSYWYGVKGQVLRLDGTTPPIPADWVLNPAFNNFVDVEKPQKAQLTNPFIIGNDFNPAPLASAPYLNKASFTGNGIVKIDDPYFTKVSYAGAFEPDIAKRWDLPWCEYDPINKAYLPTSVDDNELTEEPSIKISPNPVSSVATVLYNITRDDNVQIRIVNPAGALVSTIASSRYQTEGYYEFSIDVNQLSNGVYFVQIVTSNGIISEKFTVVK